MSIQDHKINSVHLLIPGRYAANPTGSMRWTEPHQIELHNDFNKELFYNATIMGPACYQSIPQSLYEPFFESFAYTPQGVSEDCLTADILVPMNPTSKSIAVMVQIHGGGYTSGNAQSYPGDGMVSAANGRRALIFEQMHKTKSKCPAGSMIYVSLQYRLGLFGFLGGSQIQQNSLKVLFQITEIALKNSIKVNSVQPVRVARRTACLCQCLYGWNRTTSDGCMMCER